MPAPIPMPAAPRTAVPPVRIAAVTRALPFTLTARTSLAVLPGTRGALLGMAVPTGASHAGIKARAPSDDNEAAWPSTDASVWELGMGKLAGPTAKPLAYTSCSHCEVLICRWVGLTRSRVLKCKKSAAQTYAIHRPASPQAASSTHTHTHADAHTHTLSHFRTLARTTMLARTTPAAARPNSHLRRSCLLQ